MEKKFRFELPGRPRWLVGLVLIILIVSLTACAAEVLEQTTTPLVPPTGDTPPVTTPTAEVANPTLENPTEPVQTQTTVVGSASELEGTAGQTVTPIPEDLTTPTPEAVLHPVTLPDPAAYGWAEIAPGLDSPVGIAYPPDGTGRVFVLEQSGRIRVIENDQLVPSPFLDITDRVGRNANEQGLLGLAFHPDYPQNGFFYVNYTDRNGDTVIARFQVGAEPNQAEPASESVLLQVRQPFGNHNGGGTLFGPDGYLYLSLGDGGSGGDPQNNGQNPDTLLGTILRIDVDGGDPYAIPPDNPFIGAEGRPEIMYYGLRNPWRFSFDRQTGDLYIADVGQNQWEEINFWPAGNPGGANFGWNFREGAHPYQGNPPADLELIDPVWEYGRGDGCSVTGGVVYRGQQLPEMNGVYLFGDYCSGKIWGLIPQDGTWQAEVLFETSFSITSFGEDEGGEVYLVDRGGSIYRLGSR